jgi:hypothetical protein
MLIIIIFATRCGKPVAAELPRISGIMDEGEWYPLKGKPGASGSHYVDWSRLLDAPAGKHGFLKAKDGNLYFEDGTAARFWGTNLVAKDVFASDAQLDSAVSRLAKMGCNMLRLHHMDAPWTSPNIFGNAEGTRVFSAESMRQLDYLITRCKERGIYIFLDFLVHRDFTAADGVFDRPPDLGGKQAGFFSRKLIDLQKEYIANLLNHVNQFTGIAYKDEPAIAASEFINESTAFTSFSGDILTPAYRRELESLWEERLLNMEMAESTPAKHNLTKPIVKKTSASKSAARPSYSKSAAAKAEFARFKSTYSASAAPPEPETVVPDIGPSGFAKIDPVEFISLASTYKSLAVFGLDWKGDRVWLKRTSDSGDVKESIEFLSELERGYFREMRGYVRGIGGRYVLAGSNMPLPLLAMLKDNTELDLICSNFYWDHPQVWKINDDWDRILEAPFDNRSQLKSLRANSILSKAYYRVANKPFILTEWNHCYPNEYVLEGVPLMAAYGALQGWHGILQFDFDLHSLGVDRIQNYKLSVQPEDVAQWVMAAPLFLRGDVKTAQNAVVEGVTEERYGDLPNYSDTLEDNYHLPFVTRVAKSFDRGSSANRGQYDKYYNRESGVITSETGELAINEKIGYMRIDAPRVQGVSGFIGGRGERYDFPAFKCELSNKHASIFAVSADGANLVSSKRFYIVAVGPAKMSGQRYDALRNKLENAGEGEVLTQVLNGKITFKKAGGNKLQVFPLDVDGARGKAMELTAARGALGELDLSKGRTLVYEAEAVNEGWYARILEFFKINR